MKNELEDLIRKEIDSIPEPVIKPGHPEVVTLSGKPRDRSYDGPAPAAIEEETGMHKDYWILSDEERTKGFTRPVRTTYMHTSPSIGAGCGGVTWCNIKLAETYAVNPKFYSATFCAKCKTHFPVSEFTWINTDGTFGEVVGSE